MRITAKNRTKLLAALTATTMLALSGVLGSHRAAGASLGQLSSQLGRQQVRQRSLSASLSRLTQLIAALNGQIRGVESREAAVQSELDADRAKLQQTQAALEVERARLAMLRRRLAQARSMLSRQLLSGYERSRPDVVSVVLESHGFRDLLDTIQYLSDAESQQQSVIAFTRTARALAAQAATRLARLERIDRTTTEAAAVRVRALAGMNTLLHARQAALSRATAAQQVALAASRARGRRLQHDIGLLEAQQAAAERAAAAAPLSTATALSPALGSSGGWAIPYAIVLCESGGQNLTPNSAGASGYYQIIPGTWRLFGGTGPAAYLTGKSEQDAVASRIWNGGSGASNWVCAQILGIK